MSNLDKMFARLGQENPAQVTSLSLSTNKPRLKGTIDPEELATYNYNGGNYYDAEDTTRSDEIRAQNQSNWKVLGKGMANLGVSLAKNIADIPGYLVGIGTAPVVGASTWLSGGDGWAAAANMAFDNQYLQTVQGIKDNIDEDVLKIYVPPSVENGSWSNAFTDFGFLMKNGSDMAGFVLSMWVPGAVLGKIGLGAKYVKALNALEEASELGTSSRVLTGLAKTLGQGTVTAAEALGGEQGLASLFKAGRAGTVAQEAAGIATNASKVSTIADLAADVNNIINTVEDARKMVRYSTDAARAVDSSISLGMNTVIESATEATQSYRDVYKAALAKGYTEDDARRAAASSANGVFGANLAILGVSNVVAEKFLLDGFSRFLKNKENSRIANNILSDVVGSTEKSIDDLLKQGTFAATRLGRSMPGRIASSVYSKTKMFPIEFVKEGIFEEGMQTNVSQAAEKDALRGDKKFIDDKYVGESSILNLINGAANYATLFSDAGNKELAQSIVLGGIFSGGINAVRGTYSMVTGKNTKEAAARRNSYEGLRNNFVNTFRPYNDYFEKEGEKLEDGKTNPNFGKIKLDENGKPKLQAWAKKEMNDTAINRIQMIKMADALTALDPNSIEAMQANYAVEENMFIDMLNREGGKELFEAAIQGGHVKALAQARFKANNEGKELDNAAADKMVAHWQERAKQVQARLEFVKSTHNPEAYINIDRGNKEEVDQFTQFSITMMNSRYSNYSIHENTKMKREEVLAKRTEYQKQQDIIDAQREALEFRNTDPNMTPEQSLAMQQSAAQYKEANDLFEEYANEKERNGELLFGGKSSGSAESAKSIYERLKKKQELLGTTMVGDPTELDDESMSFMKEYDNNRTTLVSEMDRLAGIRERAGKIRNDGSHVYNSNKIAKSLLDSQQKQLDIVLKESNDHLDELNKIEIEVANKYKVNGEMFRNAWEEYRSAKLKAEKAEASQKASDENAMSTLRGSLLTSDYTEEEVKELTDALLRAGVNVDDQGKFDNLTFRINTEALVKELESLEGIDKKSPEYLTRKKFLDTYTKLGTAVEKPWRIFSGINAKTKESYKIMVSTGTVKYSIDQNDLDATKAEFPFAFTQKGKRLTKAELNAALGAAQIELDAAKSSANAEEINVLQTKVDEYIRTIQKFAWQTKKAETERHVILSIDKDNISVIADRANTLKRISKFTPTSQWYSTVDENGISRLTGKSTFLQKKVDEPETEDGKEHKEQTTIQKRHRMNIEPEAARFDKMMIGVGPAVAIGRLNTADLIRSMVPVNKNDSKGARIADQVKMKKEILNKALNVMLNNTQLEINDITNTNIQLDALVTKITQLKLKVEAGLLKGVQVSQEDQDAYAAAKQDLEALLDGYKDVEEAQKAFQDNLNTINNQIAALNLFKQTLSTLSQESVYRINPENIFSMLTPQGQALLDSYLETEKQDINDKLRASLEADPGDLIQNKQNEIDAAQKEIDALTLRLKASSDYLSEMTTALNATFKTDSIAKVVNRTSPIASPYTFDELKDVQAAILDAQKTLVDLKEDAANKEFEKLQKSTLQEVYSAINTIRAAYIALDTDKLTAYEGETINDIIAYIDEFAEIIADQKDFDANAKLNAVTKLLALNDEVNELENMTPEMTSIVNTIKVFFAANLVKLETAYNSIDSNITKLDELQTKYAELKDLFIVTTKTIRIGSSSGPVVIQDLTAKELGDRLKATIAKFVEIKKLEQDRAVSVRATIDKAKNKKAVLEKELVRIEEVLNTAATTPVDYENVLLDQNGDAIIQNFRDLYNAEMQAHKASKTAEMQNFYEQYSGLIKDSLDAYANLIVDVKKALTKLALSSSDNTYTDKISALANSIPQLVEIFKGDTTAMMITLRSVFVRYEKEQKPIEEKNEYVLRTMLDPLRAKVLLSSYVANYNKLHGTEIDATFGTTTNADGTPNPTTDYNLIIENFNQALAATPQGQSLLSKLKSLEAELAKIQATAVGVASSFIPDMDAFTAKLSAMYTASMQYYYPETGDMITRLAQYKDAEDAHEAYNNTFFSKSTASSTGDRNIGAPEVDPDNEYGFIETVNADGSVDAMYGFIIRGEHYQKSPAVGDTPAIYTSIVFPKLSENADDTAKAEHAKLLELYYNAIELTDSALTADGYTPAQITFALENKESIKEYRRYAANNRFFYWLDRKQDLKLQENKGEVFFKVTTYQKLKNEQKKGDTAYDDVIQDLELQLALDPKNAPLKDLIAGKNVLLIPHRVAVDDDNNRIIVPVRSTTVAEDAYNKTAVDKIPGKVIYSVRPLAATMYPKLDLVKSVSTGDIATTEAIITNINNALNGFDLANAEASRLNQAAITDSVKFYEVAAVASTTGITITYNDLDGLKQSKVIAMTADEAKAILNTKAASGNPKASKTVLLESIAVGLRAAEHVKNTDTLKNKRGNTYLHITKINRGIPNYQRVPVDKNNLDKLSAANLIPIMTKLSAAGYSGLSLVVVTQKNNAIYAGRRPGDIVAVDNKNKPTVVIPVINALYGEQSKEMKEHKQNMLDVLGLVVFQAAANKGSFEPLRRVFGEFPDGKSENITMFNSETKKEESKEISGYTLVPDTKQGSKSISAIEFYLNFGQLKEKSTIVKDKNQIYIANGKLVFIQKARNGKMATTEILLSELIVDGKVNLAKSLQGATPDTDLGVRLLELDRYLNNKRANISPKLLKSSGRSFHTPLATKDASGNITVNSTLDYKLNNFGYARWVQQTAARTNFSPNSKRRFVQKNAEYDVQKVYTESQAIGLSDTIADAAEKAAAEKEAAAIKIKAAAAQATATAGGTTADQLSAAATKKLNDEVQALKKASPDKFKNLNAEQNKSIAKLLRHASRDIVLPVSNDLIAALTILGITSPATGGSSKALDTETTSSSSSITLTADQLDNLNKAVQEIMLTYDKSKLTAFDKRVVRRFKSMAATLAAQKLTDEFPTLEKLRAELKTKGIDIGTYIPVAPINTSPSPPNPPAPPAGTGKKRNQPPANNPIIIVNGAVGERAAVEGILLDDIFASGSHPDFKPFVDFILGVPKSFSQSDFKNLIKGKADGMFITLTRDHFKQLFDATRTTVTSKFKDNTKKTIQIAEAKRNMAAIFGEKFADEDVQLVVGLVQGEGYGAFTGDGKILLSNIASASTEFHEAFHRVWRMYTPVDKQRELIAEFETRADKEDVLAAVRAAGYKGSREYLIEEALAEEFKLYSDKYKYKNGKLVPKNKIERWFDRLLEFLRTLLGRPLQQSFYDDILAGKYRNIAPSIKYRSNEPVYTRKVYFNNPSLMTQGAKISSIETDTADISALNSAITIDMFGRKLQSNAIYELLTSKQIDTTEEYTAAVIAQTSALLVTSATRITRSAGSVVLEAPVRKRLLELQKLTQSSKVSPLVQHYLTGPEQALMMYYNTGVMKGILTELIDPKLGVPEDMVETAEELLAKMYDEKNNLTKLDDDNDYDAYIELIQEYFLRTDLAAEYGSVEKAVSILTDAGIYTGTSEWNTYIKTIKSTFSPSTVNNKSNAAIDIIALKALQEVLEKQALTYALNKGFEDIDEASIKAEIDRMITDYYKKSNADMPGFFHQWEKSISTLSSKMHGSIVEEAVKENEDDIPEESTSKNPAYDKLVYEIDPYSSMSSSIKMLLRSIPEMITTVDGDGNTTTTHKLHPELGIIEGIDVGAMLAIMINKLSNVPNYALWTEFIKLTEEYPQIGILRQHIEGMEATQKEEQARIKVTLERTFGSHLYTFLITLINKNYVVTTNANSDTAAAKVREAWQTNFASTSMAANRVEALRYFNNKAIQPKLRAENSADAALTEEELAHKNLVKDIDYYLGLLGIALDRRVTNTLEKAETIWGVTRDIYMNTKGARNTSTWSANPETFKRALFEKGGTADSSLVDSQFNYLASEQGKYQDDRSQTIFSNGKPFYAANLNSAMTLVADGMNYVGTLSKSELDRFIESELANPYTTYTEVLLNEHATAWLANIPQVSTNEDRDLYLKRIKLLMLTQGQLFQTQTVNSVFLKRAITGERGSKALEISVIESLRNTTTGDSTYIDDFTTPELAAYWVNSAVDGHNKVIQHADRSMAYSIGYTISDVGIAVRDIARNFEQVAKHVTMLAAEMNKPTTTNKYLGHDIDVLQKKLRNKKTGVVEIQYESFGIFSDLVEFMYEDYKLDPVNAGKSFQEFVATKLKTGQGIFGNNGAAAIEVIQKYVKEKQQEITEFLDVYNLLEIEEIQQFNAQKKLDGVKYKGMHINAKVEATNTEVGTITNIQNSINQAWLQSFLVHIEEALLLGGNANLYKSPADMFKRMSTQSSTGIVCSTTEGILDTIKNLNNYAMFFVGEEGNVSVDLTLDADAYTNEYSTKNLAYIQEVAAEEETFSATEIAKVVEDSQYAFNYDMARLLQVGHEKADKDARAAAEKMAADFLAEVNENDGISWVHMFADRQYSMSVDKWSAQQQRAFDFEMLVLHDAITAIDSGATEYSSESLLAARFILGRIDLTKEEYEDTVSNTTVNKLSGKSKGQEFVEQIDAYFRSLGKITPKKPQYTGPAYMDMNHTTADPSSRLVPETILKTAFDVLIPSMLRGDSPATRSKMFDVMRNMQRHGVDVLPMYSAIKGIGIKKPVKLWDANTAYATHNPELFNTDNHMFLKWSFMKDQQNIDTTQKTSLKDSIQARKNILANMTHYGVPIDYPMSRIVDGEKVYYTEDEWKDNWRSLSERDKIAASDLYRDTVSAMKIQHDVIIKSTDILESELIKGKLPLEQRRVIVNMLKEAAEKRDSPDNILSAIESILDHGWIDILPNRSAIEPILMSMVTSNLITMKRHGNAVPQIPSTGLDSVGTERKTIGVTIGGKQKAVVSATNALKSYTVNEDGTTDPAEIIIPLPDKYKDAVLKKYTARSNRPITMAEAVEMLNEDMARDKNHKHYISIEIFALRIPNQQMSSNDVFRVKKFYFGTKENFVYVPADIVVKVGSDFDIDKLQMYFPNMDENFNEIRYIDGKSALKKESKTSFEDTEPQISDSELDAYMEQLMQAGQVEKEDCNKAEDGAVTANFTPGGKWETVKDLKGMPSHKEGGVDLQINKDGDVTFKNTSGAIITAAAGLVIPNIN